MLAASIRFAAVLALASVIGCSSPGGGGGGSAGSGGGERITLSAPDLEAGGAAPAYAWKQVSGPPVALDDPTSRTPSFPAPQVLEATILGFEVEVTSEGTTLTFDVQVIVHPADTEEGVAVQNSPPVADAGATQEVSIGDTVTLDATGSTDSDGDDLTFEWTQVFPAGAADAVTMMLSDAQTATASFVAVSQGVFFFSVEVSDGQYTITALASVEVSSDGGEDENGPLNEIGVVGGGGGADGSIGFSLALGQMGVFAVRANSGPVLNAGIVRMLANTPTGDHPNGSINLDPVTVIVGLLDEPNGGTFSGSFDVTIYLGGGFTSDPCVEGTNLGSFHIVVSEGTLAVDPAGLDLAPAALAEVLTGTYTLCLGVTGDIDATLTITELEISLDAPGNGDSESNGEADGQINENTSEPDGDGPVNENTSEPNGDGGSECETNADCGTYSVCYGDYCGDCAEAGESCWEDSHCCGGLNLVCRDDGVCASPIDFAALTAGVPVELTAPAVGTPAEIVECTCIWSVDGGGSFSPNPGCTTMYTPLLSDTLISLNALCSVDGSPQVESDFYQDVVVVEACTDDADCDGLLDADDNCPNTPNPDQADADDDGAGDACDLGTDGQGSVTIDASPISGNAPLTVTMSAVAANVPGVFNSIFWDFGDGTTADALDVSHAYTVPGTYQVQVTVQTCDSIAGCRTESNPAGTTWATSSDIRVITVLEP